MQRSLSRRGEGWVLPWIRRNVGHIFLPLNRNSREDSILFNARIYADTSRYVGEFKFGYRDGKGIFTEREGNSFYGNFVKDLKDGEHVCKVMIDIEEIGQDNYEIRIGQFSKGELVKWKSKFANPITTRQFIDLFRGNRDMFDSVYRSC